MRITFLGHSGYLIDSTVKVVIDPFLTGNPKSGMEASTLNEVDIVLVTHAHPDHLGDAYSIVVDQAENCLPDALWNFPISRSGPGRVQANL